MGIFVDASYLVAAWDPRDPWHDQAIQLRTNVDDHRPLHIHALAVGEVIASLGPRLGGTLVRQAYESMMDDMVVHYPMAGDLDEAMELVVRHDGSLSLSDAYAVRTVEHEGLHGIVSFDDDFDATGVERLH